MEGKVLWVVLILGLVFRLFNFERSFFFAHDQDLYSWIAKDIVINHHQRLVGQITSVDGVFIGSFYYYIMAVFYTIFRMNPLSAVIPITILGLFNIWSLYYVVRKHFGNKVGLIASFLYAVSFGIARYDRWSVPTLPTLAWCIWFIYINLELLKGNLKVLPIYGFLVAFVWQLHIALLPILPLPIVAYILGKNRVDKLWSKDNLKITIVSVVIFLITLSPFVMFEMKHNFSQVKSMLASTKKDIGAPTGKMKLLKIIEASGVELQQRLLFGYKDAGWSTTYWFVFIIIAGWLTYTKKIAKKVTIIFVLWYGLILAAQFVSKRVVSEYYFTNMVPIFLIVISIGFGNLITSRWLLGLLGLYLLINSYWLLTRTDEDQSYLYRRQVIEYIKNDSLRNNYACISVNFIADPGVGVGFRYLSWYYGLKLVKPGTPGVPVYNIPIPWQLSMSENPKHFGRFGVLLPVKVDNLNPNNCNKSEYQLDPLLGYTE